MKKLIAVAVLLIAAACSDKPMQTGSQPDKPYFDPALADSLVVGKTTRAEVLSRMGPPYPDDPEKETGRLVYQNTLKRQLILMFKDEVLTSKEWSEKYGIGAR